MEKCIWKWDFSRVQGIQWTYGINILWQPIRHGASSHEDSVVLVGGLGQTCAVRLTLYSLTVGHNWVGFDEWDSSVILFKILETDLEMQLSSPSDDVLTRLLCDALHHRVRLGQAFEALHQLGQIGGVLAFNSHAHNRAHAELHHLQQPRNIKNIALNLATYLDITLMSGVTTGLVMNCSVSDV